MKIFQAKQQVSLLVGVCLVVLIGCGRPPATPAPPTPMVGANSIVISTFTPAPINAAETALPAFTATPSVIGRIPGLLPANITVNLEGRQFTCTIVKKGVVYYERTCTRGLPGVNLVQVVISGGDTSIVDFIRTVVQQQKNPDIKIANEILSFMASMPYEGATPDDAKAWVESTITASSGQFRDPQETMFGGVKYVLSGSPTALTLEMGELP